MTVPVIATADDLDAMLFEATPGEIVEDVDLTTEERHAAYQLAGAFAAALHALPCEGCGGTADYEAQLLTHAERWLALPDAGFSEELRRWSRDLLGADGAFARVDLVPAHTDYSPRNWLLHRPRPGPPALYIFDWELARPAPWVEDVQRTAEDHWHADPAARDAFFRGYGREPSDVEERRIRAMAFANSALGAIAWGGQRGDTAFVAKGWAILNRLRTET